jgi:Glycosyl transferase family 11
MIIAELFGGLGNQMFQYAAARSVAHKLSVPLRLNLNLFRNDSLRQYELSNFNVQATIADDAEIDDLVNFPIGFWKENREKLTQRLTSEILRKKIIREKHFHFADELREATRNTYVFGHWQSEKYFASCTDVIRKDFSFVSSLQGLNKGLVEQISQSLNPVSLHIRRTDYLNSTLMHTCDLSYYRQAIEIMSKNMDDLSFFVFSDDIGWVDSNLKLEYPAMYINHNTGLNACQDMRLMSLCRHHIIANSTFSWWGAWLSSNPNKIVVAPKQWFKKDAKWYDGESPDAKDLIPERWIKI